MPDIKNLVFCCCFFTCILYIKVIMSKVTPHIDICVADVAAESTNIYHTFLK